MLKRLALTVSAVFLVLSGCNKKCPEQTPCPPEKVCGVEYDDGGKKGLAPEFVLVEKDGRYAFSGKLSDGRTITVPIHPKTVTSVDGKPGDLTAFGPGSCPCRLPQCAPWCRPAAASLEEPLDVLFPGWGSTGTGTSPDATGTQSGSGAGTAPAPQ